MILCFQTIQRWKTSNNINITWHKRLTSKNRQHFSKGNFLWLSKLEDSLKIESLSTTQVLEIQDWSNGYTI